MKYRSIRIRFAIVIVIAIFAILPAVIIFSHMYGDMQNKTTSLLKEEVLNSTNLIGSQLGKDLGKMITASNILISNTQINALLCNQQPIPSTETPVNLLLEERFNLIRTSVLLDFNSNIDVFTDSGKIFTSILNLKPTDHLWREAEWFKEAQSSNSLPVFANHKEANGTYYILLARRMWNYGHTENNSVCVIYILEDNFYRLRIKSQLNSSDLLYIVDQNGEVISHENKDIIGTNRWKSSILQDAMAKGVTLTEDSQEGSLLITCAEIPNSEWIVVRESNYAEVQQQFAHSYGSSMLLMMLVFICMIILTLFVLLRITYPITVLSHSMRSIQDSTVRKTPLHISSGFRETQDLEDSFNKMISKINALIEDAKQQQQKESQLMIKMLQAQINPHFLFNTLNTIRWIAIVNNCGSIADIAENLGKILETSISDSRKMITLDEEIEITKSYMKIQAARFNQWSGEQMNISIDVGNCMVPKLILQPIVENCFKHAMQNTVPENIIITIHGFRNNDGLTITVSDNGVGIPADRIPSLLQDPIITHSADGEREALGLKNVNQRIKLIFGDQYGLEIESRINQGTTIRINMPIVFDSEPENMGLQDD